MLSFDNSFDRSPGIDRKQYFDRASRVVIKVGSNVLTKTDGLDHEIIRSLSAQIAGLIKSGREVILVSSGAMAAGQKKLGLEKRPAEIPGRQAIAAVGQARLMLAYESAFAVFDRLVAQVLLTGDDLTASRRRYLNARNTISTLLSWGVLPIVNENDTVSVEEIRFGDNDNLSAMITLMMNADILVNLTDIDGLYTSDPRKNPDAQRIPVIERITKKLERIASGIPGALGTGGMVTKIRAARKVVSAGVPMVIADGSMPDIIPRLFEGGDLGTFFVPFETKISNRKCWIGYTLKPRGRVRIDSGAASALVEKGKSLLPSGIVAVEGEFGKGASVVVVDTDGNEVAAGLVNYGSAEIRKIMGSRTSEIAAKLGEKPYDEVIHRNNMVVFDQCRAE